MDIAPAQLDAFVEVVKSGSISQAAKNLFVTQPAISLRLRQLETILGTQLLVRAKSGVQITEAGHQLLKYANIRKALEEELLARFISPEPGEIRGHLKIGGHFSIVNHVAIPAIAPFIKENQGVMLQSVVKEDDELPPLLTNGEVDFMFLQHPLEQPGFVSQYLGSEEYVMIEPRDAEVREGVYIDSDPSDVISRDFFKLQKNAPSQYSRCFLHNEAGILRGVLAGIGRGVIAKNEIPPDSRVRILTKYRSLKIPSYLHYMEQIHFTRLQLGARDAFIKNCQRYLAKE